MIRHVAAQTREREFSAELQSHLDLHIADNIRAGMTPDEARRQALIALGGMEQTRERYRDAITFRWLDALLKDIQFGFRTMRRSAGFTMLAIVTLAVGIAATNTAFTIMNTIMIRPLPFDGPSASSISASSFRRYGDTACRTRTSRIGSEPRDRSLACPRHRPGP